MTRKNDNFWRRFASYVNGAWRVVSKAPNGSLIQVADSSRYFCSSILDVQASMFMNNRQRAKFTAMILLRRPLLIKNSKQNLTPYKLIEASNKVN